MESSFLGDILGVVEVIEVNVISDDVTIKFMFGLLFKVIPVKKSKCTFTWSPLNNQKGRMSIK